MFSLIKLVTWFLGTLVLIYLVMGYFGYTVNYNYFTDSKKKCEEKLKNCGADLVKKGTEGAQCNFDCADPKLIIKKK